MIKFGLNSLVLVSCSLTGFVACDQQVSAPSRGASGGSASPSDNATGENPSDKNTSESETIDASKDSTALGSCAEQWTKFVAFYSKGKRVDYTGNVQVLAQTMPISHVEEVLDSTDSSVSRRISLTSTDPVATQFIGQIKIPDPVIMKKEDFVSGCESGSGKAQPVLSYGGQSAKVTETKSETVDLKSGKKSSQYNLVQGELQINGKVSQAKIKIWTSLKTPGLILKQISDLGSVPLVGSAIITEEITSAE